MHGEEAGRLRGKEKGSWGICELTAASLQRWTLRKADRRPIILVFHVLQMNFKGGRYTQHQKFPSEIHLSTEKHGPALVISSHPKAQDVMIFLLICMAMIRHYPALFFTQQNSIAPLRSRHVYSCSNYFEVCLLEATTLRKGEKRHHF